MNLSILVPSTINLVNAQMSFRGDRGRAPIEEDEVALVVVQVGAVLGQEETSGEAALALEGEVAVRIEDGVASKEGEGLIVGVLDLHPENREGECSL